MNMKYKYDRLSYRNKMILWFVVLCLTAGLISYSEDNLAENSPIKAILGAMMVACSIILIWYWLRYRSTPESKERRRKEKAESKERRRREKAERKRREKIRKDEYEKERGRIRAREESGHYDNDRDDDYDEEDDHDDYDDHVPGSSVIGRRMFEDTFGRPSRKKRRGRKK